MTLAEGLYEFSGGQFLAVSADNEALRHSAAWQSELQAGFATAGFPWMELRIRDRVATLTGTAPSAAAKEAALSAGEVAIAAHPDAGTAGLLVIDGLSVEGGERGVGESLAVLADSGITLASCQKAFTDTMDGRNVTFESGNTEISPVSERLLDAVTGVATLCRQYVIEIGGHTDSRGADGFNLELSQGRADAVRAYLVSKGVAPDSLLSVGYGETQPLDTGSTAEAYARNRRTEFKVFER
ncbi:MAG: OmpA family protein [Hyphomonas sp.]